MSRESSFAVTKSDNTLLPQELLAIVESELQADERITWMAQPLPGRMAKAMWPIVAFGIPWTAFAVFWVVGAAWGIMQGAGGPGLFSLFPLFGLPFVLIGLLMLSSPYWARRSARRSAYVLTDRRAILFTAGLRGSFTVRSIEPERLTDLRRKQHADGSGDLVFSQDIRRDSDGDRHSTDVGFMAIRDVKAVEELVRALAQKKVG